ncbi:RebB family R body protein [Chromobacterium subtsugae]|uniref:RebB family R body protein n=1 Tax=Chromobacterium subtsugae TaxID=251747 RepID=UPI0009B9D086|nr:RebB family R body protein [Chromobacterium subtsugae]
MALSTAVNSQITDAVTQANVKVVGDALAMAMGDLYQSIAHSAGILYENAASSQQPLAIAGQAASNQGVIQIYSVDAGEPALGPMDAAELEAPIRQLKSE